MNLLAILLATLGSAIGRRGAGGLWSALIHKDLGAAPPRLLWGLLVGAAVALLAPWWTALLVALCVFLGASLRGFGATGMRMGREPDGTFTSVTWKRDALLVLWHGAATVAPLAVLMVALGLAPVPLVAGVLCPVAYEAAYRCPLQVPLLGCLKISPCPTGELLFGALVGASASIPFLIGALYAWH